MQHNATKRNTEDAPRMRSCTILPQQSTSAMPIPMPMKMPLQRPFSIARNEPSQPSLKGKAIMKKNIRDYKLGNNGIIFPEWKIGKLEHVPKIHVLERSHVSLSNIMAQEITRRISECFQKESIKANFDNAKGTAEAETINHIRFIVSIFSSRCNKQIIVEVQRVLGCSYGFNTIAKVILNAAKGIKKNQPTNRASASQMYNTIPAISIDRRKKEKLSIESLEIASNMLQSNRYDTNQLAWDILLQLTSNSNNPKCPCDRSFVACIILSSSILQTLELLITKKTTVFTTKNQHSTKIRCHALTILADCLGATEKSITFEGNDFFCTDELFLSLIEELKASSTNPHEAYQAARCLRSLLLSSVQIRRLVSMHNITDATKCAFAKGTISHAMLEKESKKLMILLASY